MQESTNPTILSRLISEAYKAQLRLDSYMELLQNTYEIHRTMLDQPFSMLTRIAQSTCNCGYDGVIPLDPYKHPKTCKYAQLHSL